MSHLSDETLTALADGALDPLARERAQRHLALCVPCRVAFEELTRRDRELGQALDHDPGDAYFEDFAGRVQRRIAAEAGSPRRTDVLRRRGSWGTPRMLAWVGAVAAVLVGAELVVVVSRQPGPDLARRDLPPNAVQAPAGPLAVETPKSEAPATEAPVPPAAAERRSTSAGAGAATEAARGATGAADRVTPQRAYEVKRTAGGEDLPVRPPREQPAPAGTRERFAAPPPVQQGEGVRVRKQGAAQPLQGAPVAPSHLTAPATPLAAPAPATAPSAPAPTAAAPSAEKALDATVRSGAQPVPEAGRGLLCGQVLDDRGRPVAGAQVTVADLGLGVSTDRDGRFCVAAPIGSRTLAVMAVGYQGQRRTVTVSAQTAEVAVALKPVAVLEQPMAIGDQAKGTFGFMEGGRAATRAGDARSSALELALKAFEDQPDSVQLQARTAYGLALEAARHRSAVGFDATGDAWNRVLQSTAGTAGGATAALEARRRVAEARYRAWEAAPTPERAAAASDALILFIGRSSAGPARAQAVQWLDQVRRVQQTPMPTFR